jgi:hypothetical protein
MGMWFKPKKSETLPEVSVEVVEPKRTIEPVVTVAEIHQTFFTEVDRLLEEARIFRTVEVNNPTAYEKGKRLVSLGFTNAKTVAESKDEQKRLDNLREENDNKKLLADAIE